MTQAPLHWIRQVEQAVIDTKRIPLSGYLPIFPWEAFSKKVGALFQSSDLKVHLNSVKLLSAEAISQGFGAQLIPVTLDLTPLQGQAFFFMGKEEVIQLTALGLTNTQSPKGFHSTSFTEGFYYYLCTEVVLALNELSAFGDLGLKIGRSSPLPQEESLCFDIEIVYPKHTFFGRIVCPATLHQAFKEHFHEKQPTFLTGLLAQQTEIDTAVTIGQTELSLTEWKKVRVGDFISLDRCTFDPHTKKGTGILKLESTPLLRLRMKEDHLKIVSYVTYHEEQQSMDPKFPEPDENEEFSSPEIEKTGDEEPLWSADVAKAEREEEEETLLSTAQIPLTLIVEVGRIKMNLEDLLNLSPGNTLELPVKPEQGVDITIQGKKVAKAELIKLGELLGVKILRLAE